LLGPPPKLFYGEPPWYLTPAEVSESAAALQAFDAEAVVAACPDVRDRFAGRGIGLGLPFFDSLRQFYGRAAEREQAVFRFSH
jgi:hypothetical protein